MRDEMAPVADITVLHVDDDPQFGSLTKTMLERDREAFEVHVETDPRAVERRLEGHSVDCVVTDYDMPGMSGIELLERVRAREESLPVILFTGKGTEEVASRAISAGVTDYLQKETGTDQYSVLANRIEKAVEKRRQEQQAAKLRHRFAVVLETMKAAVFLKKPDGRYLLMNDACRELLGVDPDRDVTKLTDEDLFEPARIEEYRADDQHVVTTEETIESEEPVSTPDGEQLCLTRKSPVYDQDGTIAAICGVSTPISEQVARRRELVQYKTYVEATSEAIAVVDPDGTIKFHNHSTPADADFSPFNVEGETGFEYVHPDDRGDIVDLFTTVVEGGNDHVSTELRVETADDNWRWIETRGVNKLDDPAIEGIIVSSRDITERKEREAALRRERDRLDEFAKVVSHDLRNPLSVATARTDLARDECDTAHLTDVQTALNRMEAMIDDLLLLARQGQTVGEREPIDVETLVASCWSNVETNSATLTTDGYARVKADRSRLQAAIENLLRNAVDHGGDSVSINVGTTDDPNGIYVADDGPGVPEMDRDQVFDSGFTTSANGTGFGLAIVDRICEAHGWEITVTDSSDGGARFEITGIESLRM